MSDIVIKSECLGKKYTIGHQMEQERYSNFRDVLVRGPRTLWHKTKGLVKGIPIIQGDSIEEVWALRDVSFEIRAGEAVGIIGRNGAGKSTLLKILSRITEPTTGRVMIRGRIASLLEVGTGFHPELTGRENIFLNGTILGMARNEIKRKFDEIVAFAEVEKYLDTPVKRYSSGMYVRLAFAVAAHLESEILIVDEVLAVGDAQFQKKCLGKMNRVTADGKTVLLVSHNMASILSMSTKCILLSEGNLISEGLPNHVVSLYQNNEINKMTGQTDLSYAEHYGNGKARFSSIIITPIGNNGETLLMPVTGCDIEYKLVIKASADINNATVALIVYDKLGNRIIDVNSLIKGESLTIKEGRQCEVRFLMKNVCLKPDVYTVGLWLGVLNKADYDGIRYAASFRVEAKREDILFTNPFPGVYACEFQYQLIQ